MKKVVERSVFWRCDVCKLTYDTWSEARNCEKRGIEPRVFKKGDIVQPLAALKKNDWHWAPVKKAVIVHVGLTARQRYDFLKPHVYQYRFRQVEPKPDCDLDLYAYACQITSVSRRKSNQKT